MLYWDNVDVILNEVYVILKRHERLTTTKYDYFRLENV